MATSVRIVVVALALAVLCLARASATPTPTPTPFATPTPLCGAGTTAVQMRLDASGDDAYVYGTGLTYGTIACNATLTAYATGGGARYLDGGIYYANEGFGRWDSTGLIPAGAPIASARLHAFITSTFANADTGTLDLRYYASGNWPLDCTDWARDPSGTVANQTTLADINSAGLTRYQTFELSNVGNINTNGYTGLASWVTCPTPTGNNWTVWNSADAAQHHPILEVCYTNATQTPTRTPTPTPTATSAAATPTQTRTPTPALAGTIPIAETVTLPAGSNQIHALVWAVGKLWATTNTQPAQLIRWNNPSVSLADYDLVSFTSPRGYSSDLLYDAGTNAVYVLFSSGTTPLRIAKVDPVTLAWSDFIIDNSYANNFGSFTTDGTSLFVVANQLNYPVLHYRLSDGARTGVGAQVTAGHAIRYDGSSLWATSVLSPAPAVIYKIDPSALTETHSSFASGNSMATDDVYVGDNTYVYTGLEGAWNVVRTKKSDLTHTYITIGSGPSYGVFGGRNYVWDTVGSNPGFLARIAPADLSVGLYGFSDTSLNAANELAMNPANGDYFVSFYTSPASVIRVAGLPGEPTFTPTPTVTPTSAVTHTPTPSATALATATATPNCAQRCAYYPSTGWRAARTPTAGEVLTWVAACNCAEFAAP